MQEATSALQKVVPDLDRHLSEGSIELVLHNKWFLEGGTFDFRKWRVGLEKNLMRRWPKAMSG